jgi:microcystin-dependent protein
MSQGYQVALPNRVWDVNGVLGDGFKIYTWTATGTFTVPLTTYSDSTLLSANTNPIIVGPDGYLADLGIFVAAGISLDLQVKNSADVLQYTFTSINPMVDISSNNPSVTAVPTGGVIWSPYSTVPSGFLYCDGSLVSRATYSALNTLAAADSYPNGAGNGSTTFALPDLRGRAAYGLAASGTGSTLGETFGAMDHTHTGPSHTHSVVVTRDGWGTALNNPSTTGRLNTGDAAGVGSLAGSYQPSADLTVTSAAGGTAANGVSKGPGITGYFFIKT